MLEYLNKSILEISMFMYVLCDFVCHQNVCISIFVGLLSLTTQNLFFLHVISCISKYSLGVGFQKSIAKVSCRI
jgi:hypothetical protein